MKRNYLYTVIAFGSFLVASCYQEKPVAGNTGNEGIEMTIRLADAEVEVKSNNADDTRNENLLNSFYYFLYPKDVIDEAPTIDGFVAGISTTSGYTTTIPASSNTINNELFASDDDCQLFIVANPVESMISALTDKPTLAQLRAMALTSALQNVPQSNFLMVYDGLVKISSRANKTAIDKTVELGRLASKLTVGAYVIPSITDNVNKLTYTPVTEDGGLTVTFYNALNRTTLGGFDEDAVTASDYFNSKETDVDYVNTTTVESEDFKYYKATTPIYTYPMEWEFASQTEPYLMYKLTWMIEDEKGNSDVKDLYYKLTLGRRSLMSNDWYDISAKLTVLGSLYPDDPKILFPYMNYQVLGWKQAFDDSESNPNTSAVIKDTRYLSVPQATWTLNNKNSVTIKFSSSHPCTIANKSAKKFNFSGGILPEDGEPNIDVEGVTYDMSVPNQVTVTHTLNNTLGADMDMSPIKIQFDIQHSDETSFSQHITITQYPAIYVRTEANSAGKGTGGQSNNGKLGTVWINGAQSTTSGDWRRIAGATESGNNSSYFFTVITVSQFDPSAKFTIDGTEMRYVVGDPRDPNVNNLNVSNWGTYPCVEAPAKYSGDGQTGNRQLKYYHPTIDDGSRDNFVAPQFRVNSAYCRSRQNNSYEDVKKRCASYQEDGYPAGRWRLPTLAECQLIQVFSGKGLIPNVFIQNGTSYYYAAGWWFTINNSGEGNYKNTVNTQSAAGRCVYDEWYWSVVDEEFGWDNTDKTTFTWGDVPDDYTLPTHK